MYFYRVARTRYEVGHVFKGSNKYPLQDRFPEVETILERNRPKGKANRAESIYLREDEDFSKAGLTYAKGFVHTVETKDNVERRDLVWTGILQKRYFQDERFRRDECPGLSDDEVAKKWWAGEASQSPDWEWITECATVVAVGDDPIELKPDSPLLNVFDHL